MALGTLLIHGTLATLLFLGIFHYVARGYQEQFVGHVRTESHQLSSAIGLSPRQADHVISDLALSGEVVYAEYLSDKGVVIATMPAEARKEALVFRQDFFFGEHRDHAYFLAVPVYGADQGQLGILRLGFDETPVEERINAFRTMGIFLAVSYTVLMLALIGVSGRLLTGSINRLRSISRKIAQGHTEEAILVETGIEEVSSLAEDMEKMREELVRQKQDIASREARQKAVLETAGEGIITMDPSCVVRSFNKAAERIFECSAANVLQKPFTDLLASEEIGRFVSYTGALTLVGEHEFVGLRKSGKSVLLRLTITGSVANAEEFFTIVVQDISQRREFELQLSFQATHDALTGLPNRTLFMDRLNQALALNARAEKIGALFFIDLDRFKYVNDTLGHEFGDLLLQAVADRLGACVRAEDTLARLGGDEFTVILPNLDHIDGATVVARKILDVLKQPFVIAGREVFVGCSIGITLFPLDDNEAKELVKNADAAMYYAKGRGGSNFQFYATQTRARISERLDIELQLRHALERNELLLVYQPQVDITTMQITGVEALLRWDSPLRGLLAPGDFISIAEETGLVVPIGEWVLRTACTQGKLWHDAGFDDLSIAVNFSARQFTHSDLFATVDSILRETGLDPRCLEMELTENTLMQYSDESSKVLRELTQLGVRISVDDFGTGYSSLSYLKHYPISTLKIAKPFIDDVASDPNNAAIVSAIAAMGHSLGMKVIAEGVESQQQLDFVRAKRCDVVQGYYFGKPVLAEKLELFARQS